ncbi:ADP-ribosylglycohydrolase [Aeromonas caviae]|uniref:ADP-ribosylglycohydrolase n=1 Tax=Aeromonas caviae TaxID=648 RepID=UPI001F2FEE54|nr:ADP-ribosylglycohydrolase [Aeromonas caviae]MDH0433579.1 ADP-ribosylglycohydrolase [Aeromonas caviae]MDH0936427.1 ADP-ribosylglycohydrolase [Aeromonas caviae]MDH1397237.1 ADP-ribosylglycohydrolase [Aeromonas caviae]MDH1804422.1 ADP-ribosylglycohydrolase [Aeromonas caviae]
MNQHLVPGQGDAPLIKGIACLLSAERVTELTSLLGKGGPHQVRGASPLAVVTALAIHIEQHRLDRTLLPIYQGREQLMAGAADLLGREASFEDQDAFRLLALLLDKLLRGGGDSRQAKLDGLTPSVMEQRALAAISPNTGSVVRGSWRRKSRNQLGHASWLDVVEAALWCFWHGDAYSGRS